MPSPGALFQRRPQQASHYPRSHVPRPAFSRERPRRCAQKSSSPPETRLHRTTTTTTNPNANAADAAARRQSGARTVGHIHPRRPEREPGHERSWVQQHRREKLRRGMLRLLRVLRRRLRRRSFLISKLPRPATKHQQQHDSVSSPLPQQP